MEKICVECGKEYEAKTNRSKYCSASCKSKNRAKRVTKIKKCKWCGEEFIEFSNKGERNFCSFSCGTKYLHHNIKEKHLTCSICGKDILFKGTTKKLYCDECRKKVNKESQIKCDIKRGRIKPERVGIGSGNGQEVLENSPYFKTGIGVYRKIKKMSMEELKCERCGSTENLHVHHRDEDRHNNKIENLELLCKPCHKKEHMGGEKNNFAKLTKEQVVFIYTNPLNLLSAELQLIFNVSHVPIRNIYNNKSWTLETKDLVKNKINGLLINVFEIKDENNNVSYAKTMRDACLKCNYNPESAKSFKKLYLNKDKSINGYLVKEISINEYIEIIKKKIIDCGYCEVGQSWYNGNDF